MKVLTAKQAAELLGTDANRVCGELIKPPYNLPCVPIGDGVRFIEGSVLSWKPTYERIEAERRAERAGRMTTKEIAELLNLKPSAIYGLARNHGLPHEKERCGRVSRYIFNRDRVSQWKCEYDAQEADRRESGTTTKDIADLLSFSVSMVYALAKNGGLPCETIPHGKAVRYIFNKDTVIDWFIAKETGGCDAEDGIAELIADDPTETPEQSGIPTEPQTQADKPRVAGPSTHAGFAKT